MLIETLELHVSDRVVVVALATVLVARALPLLRTALPHVLALPRVVYRRAVRAYRSRSALAPTFGISDVRAPSQGRRSLCEDHGHSHRHRSQYAAACRAAVDV